MILREMGIVNASFFHSSYVWARDIPKNLSVIGAPECREDRLDPLDLHDFEVAIDGQQQSVIDGEGILGTHRP